MSFVLDASIVLAFILPDESEPLAALAMDAISRNSALAPVHWPLEIANGLLIAQRRRRITPAIRLGGLADAALLPVELDDQTQLRAWGQTSDIAAKYNLSIYDAAYLELAHRKRLPLATLDKALQRAAAAEAIVAFANA